MTEKDLQDLIRRYVAGEATPAEQQLVEGRFLHYLRTAQDNAEPAERDADLQEIRATLTRHIADHKPVRRLWSRIAAAASLLLILSAGGYFLIHKRQTGQQTAQLVKQDIAPGRNQATLTLANGQQIILTKGLSGKLAQQGNTSISVNGGNAIAYQVAGDASAATVQYNTLTTKNGEQSPYPLVLADGTKVWLNARSSITIPTVFNSQERLVKVTGEAYFEVVHNAAQPFRVKAGDQIIEDVGTHFNVNAYSDEPSERTTLLEGAVDITAANKKLRLNPGQQSSLKGDRLDLVPNADVTLVMGWHEGHFRFKDAGIEEMMRQFARWYDVEVVYEGKIPAFSFTGALHRNINASQALQVLDIFNVHHRIEGKKIIITP